MKHETFIVEGMTCNHCVMSIQKSLGGVSGVKEVKVDLNTKKVDVDFDENVRPDQMKEAIINAGYAVL